MQSRLPSWLPSCCHHTLCNSWQQQCTHQLYFKRDSVKIFRKRLMRLQRTEWWSHFPCLDRFDWYAMQCHTSYTMQCHAMPHYPVSYHGMTEPLCHTMAWQLFLCYKAWLSTKHWYASSLTSIIGTCKIETTDFLSIFTVKQFWKLKIAQFMIFSQRIFWGGGCSGGGGF